MRDPLTVVTERYRKNRLNYRILFGAPTRCVRLDWQRKLQVFQPGNLFAYERWEGNKYGTQSWSVVVCRASKDGRSLTRIPGILPGVDVLVHAKGRAPCERVFAWLDALKAVNRTPLSIPIRQWRAVQMALKTGVDMPAIAEGSRC